ncbi:hypothetical protein [Serratia sp. M24T3]|uniref:hypothetical protein n=1 Tax=Serratia sp. M24T3 TaxID=932213 RepID=UPI00025B8F29|nr:hypothetical protein [Serratia sp. M24T3]EIC83967.1 hypothetical protein SPM24T3_13660 [Serratia sp. M24T3]
MPILAFRNSAEIIDPLFEQLSHPDDSVSLALLEKLIPTLPFEYQRNVAYGITRLIEDDVLGAVDFFDRAFADCPPEQRGFVISNTAASFGVNKRYSRELFYLKKSLSLNNLHLLKYASHVAAKWCEFSMLKDIERKLAQLNAENNQSDDMGINKMFSESKEMLSTLGDASEGERESLNLAANLVLKLAEEEGLPIIDTKVWKDDEDCYCYAFYLHEDCHDRFQELDRKLDRLITDSMLDYTHVTPVIFFGGAHVS